MSEDKSNAGLEAMAGDWLNDFSANNNGNGDNNKNSKKLPFLNHKEVGTYDVRLVGKYVKYLSYYKPFEGKRVITHPTYKDKDPAWVAKFYPQVRFAIHVIDRKDGKLKILDASKTLFKEFYSFMQVNKIDPTGKNAPDFTIIVSKNGPKKEIKASAKRADSPLTNEEVEMIMANKVDLKQIYRATSLQKIQEFWDALPDEKKVPDPRDNDSKNDSKKASSLPKKEVKAATPTLEAVEESMPDAPAEDDDLFGDGGKKDDGSW
jgi:hypothetical protein